MAAKKTPRKTLYEAGRRGDSIRVLVDERRDRVVVQYRDSKGLARKRFFDNTREGKAEARAWAQSYHATRAELEQVKTPVLATSLELLWRAFVDSPTYAALREKTKIAYGYRWAKWELFLGADASPDSTTVLDVDRFISRGTKIGIALNQIRQVINTARVVYKWGQTRKLVRTNELSLFRWQQPKDAPTIEPPEYSEEEYLALLRSCSPQDGTRWRLWVVLMLAGHHGMRANAVLHLRWTDIDDKEGIIVWPAQYQKNGRDHVQPLTWDAVSGFETARLWRRRMSYTGPWVIPAGGGNSKLGQTVKAAESRQRAFSRQTMRSYRKERTREQDVPYTYGGMWAALRKAEERAGVTHLEYRALHGMRKMSAGNVADATNDARLGMEWIGDRDPKQMNRYLKRRTDRMERAAAASGTSMRNPEQVPQGTTESVPEVSLNDNGPIGGHLKINHTNTLARATGRD